ncbi:molecular chaperone GrpE [Breznakia sp. PF5-3]|uniref:nucleotide exchange factor GrpE n=1 Tax=unclassified Breznakia TaxID=2623764 RepID=UPI00240656CA|nr:MULTISPECIES: nucleotide exchange factor GrpE [unclassified Breznakia]MDF9823657.1 molecular chaperone GrpE [Breznakia sp. PM6-1]MDF9834455.1 molecular chaperone GrpE [Breznakia sp. PF5-3]MDF9838612.1 molecular chaperone GrpE [Breznakia sp. PFB2-8]MDF9860651.1 molecular chaperone GrpE [Breznakia sp. PH5-24]
MSENKKVVDEEVVAEEILEEQDSKTDVEESETAPTEKKLFKKKKKKEELLEEEITSLKEELGKMQNAYYTAYADTENLRKRLQNDADMLKKYRIQSFAQEILPAIDNLERAINFEAKEEDMKNYVEGIKMIYQQIKTALEKEGVTAIDCLEKPFDPNLHQALVSEKVEGVESGIVVEEIQKGYLLKDRVLRASLVKVSE